MAIRVLLLLLSIVLSTNLVILIVSIIFNVNLYKKHNRAIINGHVLLLLIVVCGYILASIVGLV